MSPTDTDHSTHFTNLPGKWPYVWDQMKQRKYKKCYSGVILSEDTLKSLFTRLIKQSIPLQSGEPINVSNNVQLITLLRIPGEECLEEY